jgi:transposase
MSTSFIYHAFGAQTFDYQSTEYKEGAVYVHIRKKPQWRRCVACRSREVTLEGQATYTLRTLPVGSKPVYLVLHLHVLRCQRCKLLLQEGRDVADPRKSYTRAFGRFVVDLSRSMTMLAVARHLHVGWDLVKEIIKAELERRKRRRSWRKVRRIGIDEIAIRKGHRYMTVVVDMDSGEVLFTAEGRDHECLQPFFVRLKRAGAQLKAITMDMSPSYLKAVQLYAPADAIVIHDHYHVVANMNEVVDEVRRDEQNRLEGEGKDVIKGSRYLLLKAKEKLQQEPQKQARLDALLNINETLHKVYLLKEDLRLFWSQDSKQEARDFITGWLETAKSIANTHVTRFAQTVEKAVERIVAWYDHPISTGPLEGLNNKIKVLKRAAYGYRDMEFFGLRLLFLHETAFQLSGV